MYKETLDVDGDGDNETSDMTTAYYYDGLDRLAKQVGPDDIEAVLEYDAFGNMVCRMDDPDTERYEGLDRVTEYDFDRLGRQIAITAYDPNDTTEHVAEQTTTYAYNKNGQVTKITYPDDSFVEYIYNSLRIFRLAKT